MKLEGLQPIGSVIRLKDGKKKLMITGLAQRVIETGVLYDYSAVMFPEGFFDGDHMYFFNDDAIGEVFFTGYINDDTYVEIASAVATINKEREE